MRRSTWVVLLVFGLLVGFTWLFQRYQANKTASLPTSTALPTVEKAYDLANQGLSELTIEDNQGNKIDLYRNSTTTDLWEIRDVPTDKADNIAIQTAISELLSINIIDRLAVVPPLESIGLVFPQYTLTMQTPGGQQIITDVGIETPIETGYYIRVGSGTVLIVDKSTLDGILNYLQEPPLIATPTPGATESETGTPIAPDNQVTPTP